jgi:hypothetical protein
MHATATEQSSAVKILVPVLWIFGSAPAVWVTFVPRTRPKAQLWAIHPFLASHLFLP